MVKVMDYSSSKSFPMENVGEFVFSIGELLVFIGGENQQFTMGFYFRYLTVTIMGTKQRSRTSGDKVVGIRKMEIVLNV